MKKNSLPRWRPLLLVALFVVTRYLIFLLWQRPDVNFVANDVSYYGYHLDRLDRGEHDVMMEYPPPAVWILRLLYRIGLGWQTWFPVFAGFMMTLDGLVALSLYRAKNTRACLFWMLFTAANGAIVWFRFDLIPAALVAWACLLLVTRPFWAGAFVGAGAAIKLWPALLIAPMLAPNPRRNPALRRLLGFITVGGGLGIISVALEGFHRNVTPLTWQSERGLQIESVVATPIMFLRTFTDAPHWTIRLSEYNALELFGPGVDVLLRIASLLTVASLLLTGIIAWRLISRNAEPTTILLGVLSVVLATIVANKTLSPQYILWLGGPVAVLVLHVKDAWLRRHVTVLAVTLILVGAMTQFTYPWGAYGIMALPLGSGPEMSVLILRNLTVVAMLCHAAWLTFKTSSKTSLHRPEQLATL